MSRQLSLITKNKRPISSRKRAIGRPRQWPVKNFGGQQFQNYNPREQRPIQANQALHIVLRSSMAKGKNSMLSKGVQQKIWDIIYKHAALNGVTIYEYANAGNHLHLLIRVKRRDFYRRFIRSITGLIARAVRGAERGKPMIGKFWDSRPFSRIVQFKGTEFKKVKLYLKRNTWEAIGFIPYIKRSKKLTSEWKAFWSDLVYTPL